MVRAYILIHAEMSQGPRVTGAVAGLKGVVSVDGVAGPYDIVAVAEAESLAALNRDVVDAIHALPGVSRTLTCPVIHG